jgi:thymidylate kinase
VVEPGRVIAVEGSSGAGKTTLARRAARSFGWVFLAEAYDRTDPPPNLRFGSPDELLRIERTLLAEERRRYREAERRRRRGETVIADTGFLGPLTYTAGLVALGEAPFRTFVAVRRLVTRRAGRPHDLDLPDLVIYLDVPSSVRRRRASLAPRRHPREFRRRHEAVGRIERRFYRESAVHGAAGRIRFVRASGSPRALIARVRRLVRSLPPRRAQRPSVADLVPRLARMVRDERGRRARRSVRHR